MTNQNLTLAAVANATSAYGVEVTGNALAPRIADGQLLAIRPAVNADPATLPARSIVLAIAAPDPAQPRRFCRPSLFSLNADGDLIGGSAVIPAGAFIVLGVAQEGVNVTAA